MFGFVRSVRLQRQEPFLISFPGFQRAPPYLYLSKLPKCKHDTRRTHIYTRYRNIPSTLAPGRKYNNMNCGWRVPHNTISVIVRCKLKYARHIYIDVDRLDIFSYPFTTVFFSGVEPLLLSIKTIFQPKQRHAIQQIADNKKNTLVYHH